MELTINPEFQSLIPPLAPEELSQLETNLKADGCRDPLVTWNGVLLDGHNRFAICNRNGISFNTKSIDFLDDTAAKVWIIRNQFGRRNLAPFTRVELALKLEPLLRSKAKENQANSTGGAKPQLRAKLPEAANTRTELAKVSGVSARTVDAGRLIAERADEETKAKLRRNEIAIHRVAKDLKESEAKKKRNEARKSADSQINPGIIVGDFSVHSASVKSGSVSLIFTDPPYDRASNVELKKLAIFADDKLCGGGSLLCYVGHTQLPDALDILRQLLRYWWTAACVHSGGSSLMREYGIKANWKPILWFVKGTRHDNSVIVDDVVSGGREKGWHDWQQSESEAAYWIKNLCPKDGIVCDPFLGGGTTAAAAKSLGIKWIGFERDPVAAAAASERLSK